MYSTGLPQAITRCCEYLLGAKITESTPLHQGHTGGGSAIKHCKAQQSAVHFLSVPMLTNWAVQNGSAVAQAPFTCGTETQF